MTLAQIIISGIALLILIALNAIPMVGQLVSNLVLFVFFLFAQAQIDPMQGAFYTALLSLVFIFHFLHLDPKDIQSAKLLGKTYKGIYFSLFSVAIGISIFLFIKTLSGGGTASIIGIPKLLAVSSTTAALFSPAIIGSLGFIENRAFIGMKKAADKYIMPHIAPFFGVLYKVVTFIVIALLFALFHGTVLGMSFSIFAFLVFLIWLVVAESPLGEEPTSISHYLWNVSTILKRQLAVAL